MQICIKLSKSITTNENESETMSRINHLTDLDIWDSTKQDVDPARDQDAAQAKFKCKRVMI